MLRISPILTRKKADSACGSAQSRCTDTAGAGLSSDEIASPAKGLGRRRPAKPVPERVPGALDEAALRADECAPAYARQDAAIRPGLEARAKAAADDALLNPDLAGAQFSVGGEAGELGAGPGSARRAVVGAARAEDEIAAHRVARPRGGEKLDMVDSRAVPPAHAQRQKRVMNGGRGLGQTADIGKLKLAGRRGRSEEEPVAAPRDIALDLAEPLDLDRDRARESMALDILDDGRLVIDKLDADDSDRRLEAMAPSPEAPHMGERDGEADRPVAAHAEIADIVEEDDARRA